MACKGGGRCSKFNPEVLKEKDSNGDLISIWCIASSKPDEAICTICNVTVFCKHHGSNAVKRHAKNLKHIEECKKIRNKDGTLMKPTQRRIEFSNKDGIGCELTHQEKVSTAEVQFVIALATKGIPYSFSDTATMLFPKMFDDSKVAKDFTCSRTKASYLISDGIGPHYKEKLLNEIRNSGVFYSLIVDETPLPEKRCQQLDVLIRFFSFVDNKITVQHLQSFHIGHGTADVMFHSLSEVLDLLPKEKLLCFSSDGPNVMKSLKNKVKVLHPQMLDLPTCSLHKVHNSFAAALCAFGEDVEVLITDLYYFFRQSSAKSADLKNLQQQLGNAESVLVKHVSSRWLTLEKSLKRFIEMFHLVKTFFEKSDKSSSRDSMRYKRLKQTMNDKLLLPKALFLKNVSMILNKFLELFQTEAPLIHILYDEMCTLLKTLLGRFINASSFLNLKGTDLKSFDVEDAKLWKSDSLIDIGADTAVTMKELNLTSSEKNAIYKGARAFYVACTKKLIKTLPLENRFLFHMQVLHPIVKNEETSSNSIKYLGTNAPLVITPEEVSLLQDEWTRLRSEPLDRTGDDQYGRIDEYWGNYFLMKNNMGEPKFPLITKLFRAILSIPHGSADIERGFSINKNILDNRSKLNELSVNGLRHVISYVNRIGGLEKLKVDRETIKVARSAYQNYSSRMEREKDDESKKRKESDHTTNVSELKTKESVLEKKLKASQDLLETAEKNIKDGLSRKNFSVIESGQILLSEAKSRISANMTELEEVRKQISLLSAPPSKKCK